MGTNEEFTTILDMKIPSITIPVKPGRNLAIIIEVAAMNKESKIIRGILLGFTAAGFGVAAGIYIRQIYRSVSNTQAFVMLSMLVMLPALMTAYQKTRLATERARAQSEFLSNMSHEIRTPLNGLIGLNHMMMLNIDKAEQREQVKDWLRKSYGTANYLLSLVILYIAGIQETPVGVGLDRRHVKTDYFPARAHAQQAPTFKGLNSQAISCC